MVEERILCFYLLIHHITIITYCSATEFGSLLETRSELNLDSITVDFCGINATVLTSVVF